MGDISKRDPRQNAGYPNFTRQYSEQKIGNIRISSEPIPSSNTKALKVLPKFPIRQLPNLPRFIHISIFLILLRSTKQLTIRGIFHEAARPTTNPIVPMASRFVVDYMYTVRTLWGLLDVLSSYRPVHPEQPVRGVGRGWGQTNTSASN